MSATVHVTGTDKGSRYGSLLPQIEALVANETDLIANISNITSALKYGMGFYWVGIYFVKGDELVLGPYQGPVACTRIARGRGVCGTCWEKKRTIIVPDVDKFEGHIACSSETRSEIVIPVIQNDVVLAVLDIDSEKLNDFDLTDREHLEKIAALIQKFSFS